MDETETSDAAPETGPDTAPEPRPELPPFVTATRPATDIRARIQEAGGLSLDRLPMLSVVFDRLATACSDAAKHLASSSTFYSLSGVESGRFGEMLDAYDSNAVVGIFHAPEWDGHILVGLDRDFIYTMVEVLFGADGSEPPVEEERNFSAIELRIAQAARAFWRTVPDTYLEAAAQQVVRHRQAHRAQSQKSYRHALSLLL